MASERAGARSVSLAHEQLRLDPGIRRSSDRAFGFVLGMVLCAFGLWPLLASREARRPVVGAALLVLAMAAVCPRLLAPLHRVALAIAILMNRVTSPLVMAVLFFGLFTPIALVVRRFGSRSLDFRTGWRSNDPTYWVPCPADRGSRSMEVPF